MRRRLSAVLACAALAAVAVAGCGDDDGGGDVDVGTAAAVPENAPLYFDAAVKPTGAAQTDANAALGKILDTNDPGAKLVSLIDKEAQQQPANERFTYELDIAPWLGNQIGFFATSLAEDNEGAVIVETTNPQSALAFAQKAESGATQQQPYNGTTYFKNPSDGDTFATVGDFLVFGQEADIKAAIDANGGDSLGDSSDFKDAIGDLPDDRLGTFYTVPRKILDAIPADQIDPSAKSLLQSAAGDNLDDPVGGALTASADSLDLEFQSQGGGDVETPESALIGAVPGDSWLALGIGDFGSSAKQLIDELREAGIPGLDQGIAQAESATGTSIDELADALGDAVIWVKGTTEQSVNGALVIQVTNTDLTSRLLGQLQSLLTLAGGVKPLTLPGGGTGFQFSDPSQTPQPVEVAQQGDKLVVGYGTGSAQEGLQPGQPLSSSPGFTTAKGQISSLGADLFLSFPPIFQLAKSSGSAKDPDYQQAKPYIDSLDYLVSGSGSEDGKSVLKAVLGLK
jgi:Protein of unknown function (DUF3352)